MRKKIFTLLFIFCLSATLAKAQQAEVTIQLSEQFFEVLLDAIFKNSNPPEFPLAMKKTETDIAGAKSVYVSNSLADPEIRNPKSETANCTESIKLQREINGTRTAVRFRDGRVVAPIAFTGNYNPPLIGCLDFSGVAQTVIDLEFDADRQALIGRARVLEVNLSGTGGLGSGILARMVQNSIDKKINPIQILAMDRISFVVPIQNAGSLRMRATGLKPEIANGILNVRISYEFQKAD